MASSNALIFLTGTLCKKVWQFGGVRAVNRRMRRQAQHDTSATRPTYIYPESDRGLRPSGVFHKAGVLFKDFGFSFAEIPASG